MGDYNFKNHQWILIESFLQFLNKQAVFKLLSRQTLPYYYITITPHRKSLTSSAAKKTSTGSTEDKIKELIQEALKFHEKDYIEEINALKAEMIELKHSQQFLSAQYDQLKTNYDKLNAKNKNQVTELHDLKSQSAAIKAHNSKEAESWMR